MRRTLAVCITAAALLACGLSGGIDSLLLAADQWRPDAPGAALSKGYPGAIPVEVEVEARPPGDLGTIVRVAVQGRDAAFAQAITGAFQKAPVPPSRLRAFAMFKHPNFQIKGWSILVQEIDDLPGGMLVKVNVAPLLSSTLGASTTVLGGAVEWYRFDGKGLHLLKPEQPADPPPAVSLIID